MSIRPEYKKQHKLKTILWDGNLVITKYQMYINPRKSKKLSELYIKPRGLSNKRPNVERRSFGLQTQFEDSSESKFIDLPSLTDDILKEYPITLHEAKKTSGMKLEHIKSSIPRIRRMKYNFAGTSRNLLIQGGSIAAFQAQFRTNNKTIRKGCNEKKLTVIPRAKKYSLKLNTSNVCRSIKNKGNTIDIKKPKEYITLSLRKGKLIKGPSGPKLNNKLNTIT